MRRVNVEYRAIYLSRLLTSGSITGVDQRQAKRFLAQMLESTAVSVLTMDNELYEGAPEMQIQVHVHDYRTA